MKEAADCEIMHKFKVEFLQNPSYIFCLQQWKQIQILLVVPLVLWDGFAQSLSHVNQIRTCQSLQVCMFHSSALCPNSRKTYRFKILECQSVGKVEGTCKVTFFSSFPTEKLDRILLQKSQMATERLSLKTSHPPQLK